MKIRLKRLLCGFLAGICMCSLIACRSKDLPDAGTTDQGTTESQAPPVDPYTHKEYKTLDCVDQLKVIGRSSLTDKGIAADFSASGIEFNAQCRGSVTVDITSSNDSLFGVFINGEMTKEVRVFSGTRTYTVATDLSEGTYYIRILKQRAARYLDKALLGSIDKITMEGTLMAPPAEKEHYIEFIGDSILSGGGVKGASDGLPYALSSFGFLTAEALNADYSMVCTPGLSVNATSLHIHQIYQYVNGYRTQEVAYTPTRKADLVVISLNTNDSNDRLIPAGRSQFKQAVRDLINDARAFYGDDVNIVWMFDMMIDNTNSRAGQWTNEVIEEYNGTKGHIYTLTVTRNQDGANSHPSEAAHKVMSEELTKFITDNNLLG